MCSMGRRMSKLGGGRETWDCYNLVTFLGGVGRGDGTNGRNGAEHHGLTGECEGFFRIRLTLHVL